MAKEPVGSNKEAALGPKAKPGKTTNALNPVRKLLGIRST